MASQSLVALGSGNLVLSGSIPALSEISITQTPAGRALPLTTSVSELLVATSIERSNCSSGYAITIASANWVPLSGPSFRSADSSDILPYAISYDGKTANFIDGVATVTDSMAQTGAQGWIKEIAISFDGSAVSLAATSSGTLYSDTLTFTIVAK